jgi:hypothetical protein
MTAISGRYCVQFMTFNRGDSDQISKWWQERCVEWCFARSEDGKFGDQKYLDDWTERFSGFVHVLENQGWAMGPWNIQRFPYSSAKLFHFHGLRTVRGPGVQVNGDAVPTPTWNNIYLPYIQSILDALSDLEELKWTFNPQAPRRSFFRIIGSRVKRNVGMLQRFSAHRSKSR